MSEEDKNMKIDRHNYEEYFVLYWDNELTEAQKKEVDTFVEQHKDLQEEFRLFGETRFTPDENIVLKEKDFLFNADHTYINSSDYTEHLLSYIDNELTGDQKAEVEKYIANHPAVQQELSILQKTKLQPDTSVIFPDKSILYRTEEKVSVIRMTWFRVAVAAMLILIAGLVTFRLINPDKKDGTPSIAKQSVPTENKQPENSSPTIIAKQETAKEQELKPEIKTSQKSVSKNLAVQNTIAKLKEDNKNNLPKEKRVIEQQQIAQNTLPTVMDEPVIIEPKKSINDAVVVADDEKKNELFEKTNVTERPSSAYTVYNPSVDQKENAGKGGLKGFLRKATRVFEHRTKMQATTDDDKLLVGMFAVSLK
jgi:hypothetical protein